jgi:hypothetical protein
MLRLQQNVAPYIQTDTITQVDINQYEVKSMTRKNKTHTVTLLDSKTGACFCEDFEYRKRVCKHIVEVMIKVVGIISSS